jgi:hypothetical protein
MDPEYKITEFDYENFIPQSLLNGVDTKSSDFKKLIKALNMSSRTSLELLEDQKEGFKELMPLLKNLT